MKASHSIESIIHNSNVFFRIIRRLISSKSQLHKANSFFLAFFLTCICCHIFFCNRILKKIFFCRNIFSQTVFFIRHTCRHQRPKYTTHDSSNSST